MSNKAYITTPIYYVNDIPHIGHAYTTIIADSLARFYRLKGYDTFFLTGTDEHGQKIEQAALAKGKSAKEYADEISAKFKALWDDFDISYDCFIRTTDENHKLGAQKAFETMFKNGDIYKGEYEGHYCVSCETFFTDSQLINDEYCPDCGKITTLVKEESYFFRLSAYQDKLLKWYQDADDCVMPRAKKNEVINFVKQGLRDLSITRASFDWGIKLPPSLNDSKHVLYVWLDALVNYISALGYGTDEKNFSYWPASFHLVGKDILRFHSIYWPAFLMSLNLPLPKHIAAHGWWTRNGEKMSKSKGNVVNPREVTEAYGLENFRYFMLREVPFGQDGDFSQKALIDRVNSDLGNELGNLLNRIIGMSGKYNNYELDSSSVLKFYEKDISTAHAILKNVESYMCELQTNKYLEELWKVLTIANQSITIYEPWTKMKEGKIEEVSAIIALTANLLAKVSILFSPVMPKTAQNIAKSLGFELNAKSYEQLIINEGLLDKTIITPIAPLFPRIEKELMSTPEPAVQIKEIKKELINADKFFASKIQIGTIVKAETIEKSDKLLKLFVDIGEEKPRQILSGIKVYYDTKSLEGMQVCVVTNLKPIKIMGLESCGMVLTAEDKDGITLITPQNVKSVGATVK
ncbi:MAG: methionine--tRNA ligase [Campylobacteraceae bacterium]|jgi:methionyl-tRNA synthetase|nr:methionine--tRNA ligase [Campylobacteraceae bacterium]